MNNEPIVIRPARSDDLTQLSALWYEKTVILSQQDRRWQVGDGARAHWEEQVAGWLGEGKCAMRVAVKPHPPTPSPLRREGEQYSQYEDTSERMIAPQIPSQAEGSQKLVVEHIVGYGIGWVQAAPPGAGVAALGMITDLAIDAHGYHAGAARGLVAALREWFAAQGVKQTIASVPQRDAVAQAFWRSYGAAEWMEWLWITS